MKNVEQVLEAANAAYDNEIKKNPRVNDESGRAYFVLGYLKSAYERLLNEYNSLRIA